mgnify:CR=1 FL=1
MEAGDVVEGEKAEKGERDERRLVRRLGENGPVRRQASATGSGARFQLAGRTQSRCSSSRGGSDTARRRARPASGSTGTLQSQGCRLRSREVKVSGTTRGLICGRAYAQRSMLQHRASPRLTGRGGRVRRARSGCTREGWVSVASCHALALLSPARSCAGSSWGVICESPLKIETHAARSSGTAPSMTARWPLGLSRPPGEPPLRPSNAIKAFPQSQAFPETSASVASTPETHLELAEQAGDLRAVGLVALAPLLDEVGVQFGRLGVRHERARDV